MPRPNPPSRQPRQTDGYTVQAGDTLVGIARRLGLTPQPLAKANALDRPDKIVVGNGLRLQFDDAGQVRALLYSSASGKDIPFTRVKK